MAATTGDSEAYLGAFMNGFDFILLAMQGRLAEGTITDAERDRIEAFLEDYRRISTAFRDRKDARSALTVLGPMPIELAPAMAN